MTEPVYFATNNGDIAGGEVMLFNLAGAARELGCTVAIVGPSRPSEVLDRARSQGFAAIEIKAGDRWGYLRGLRRWDAGRQGLLWCNGLAPAFATAGHRNRVVHLHQRPTGRLQSFFLAASRIGARRLFVPSTYLMSQIPGSSVLANWTEPRDAAAASKARRARDSDSRTVGFMGRLSTGKGVEVLAQAMSILAAHYPKELRLLIAGDGRNTSTAELARAEEALVRIPGPVERTGWLDRETFFNSVDLAVFPSVYPESFGLVACEAMSASVPFVITDAGALPEVAGPGFPFVARASDPHSLAATMERALDEPWDDLGATCHRRWQDHFSPEAGLQRMQTALIDLGVLGG